MARTETKPQGRILVADDEAAIANGLSAILSDAGYEVEVASDGQKALERLASDRFGVVLADLTLPKEILENELFGHEKGAFTGSTNEKQGAFELADSGTLFLDEIAEMSSDVQVKLLRALESRQVRRLGGKKEIDVDIRVVAATNRNVEEALADNDMREDL